MTDSPYDRALAPADDPDAPPAPVHLSPSRDRIDDLALVLTAVGIPNQIARQPDGLYSLWVARPDEARANRALSLYEAESRAAARTAPAAPDRGSVGLGIVVGMALAAFMIRTGTWENNEASRWFTAGVADASRIRAGEWWRAITAMTLHADVMHLGGNIAASVIFLGAAGRWLGAGLAAALIVIAGLGANLLTAWTEKRDHLSVGASTATFAALGLVVGLQLVRRWRGGGFLRRRAWIAAGAGLGLLAMLGMGAKSDVFAHAYGLGLGTVLGVIAGILDRPAAAAPIATATAGPAGARTPRTIAATLSNAALALAAAGAVVGAWARALAQR